MGDCLHHWVTAVAGGVHVCGGWGVRSAVRELQMAQELSQAISHLHNDGFPIKEGRFSGLALGPGTHS